jgi:hypothetical protein
MRADRWVAQLRVNDLGHKHDMGMALFCNFVHAPSMQAACACLPAATTPIHDSSCQGLMLLVPAVCSGSPPQPSNGSFDCTSPALPGSVCNATCDAGYAGAPFAMCQPNGTYSNVTGACELIGGLRNLGLKTLDTIVP